MIDLIEIRETIDEIKRNGTTVAQAEKLALLYIAAEHMEKEERGERSGPAMKERYSHASALPKETIEVDQKSEFLSACNGAKIKDVLMVLDEHMEAIKVLYPKEHDILIERIEKTHR